ncbi:MAG: hypothetical protein E3J72_16905 [Planctomycetota bacterium]|nr:MAG: hypothetical protein E3J72_16905 [Planctomycetota bacterium]
MKRDLEKWSLVLLGKWNTRLLSPKWIREKIFQLESDDDLRFFVPMVSDVPPKYEAHNMIVTVSEDKILLSPIKPDDETLQRIEDTAKRLLEILKYTPVSAFGENFHYIINISDVPPILINLFKFEDSDILDKCGKLRSTALERKIEIGECMLNIRIVNGDNYNIGLNYHYSEDDADAAAKDLENTYIKNRDHGQKLLQEDYGLAIQEE